MTIFKKGDVVLFKTTKGRKKLSDVMVPILWILYQEKVNNWPVPLKVLQSLDLDSLPSSQKKWLRERLEGEQGEVFDKNFRSPWEPEYKK